MIRHPTMTNQRVGLVLNSSLPSKKFIEQSFEGVSRIIACDGAYDKLKDLNIKANLVVGDMDSAKSTRIECEIVAKQDQTLSDFEAALNLVEKDAKLVILGMRGGDLQHEISNLLTFMAVEREMVAKGEEYEIYRLLPQTRYCFGMEKGTEFSIFTTTEASGVDLKGANYSLEKGLLRAGSLGLHNVAAEDTIQIEYFSGGLILVRN